jgi:deoxyribose-phosphate aldolase
MDLSLVDQEAFDPGLSPEQIAAEARQAANLGVGGVCVEPYFVSAVARALEGTGTQTVAVLRTRALSKSTVKAIETTSAIKDGAGRIEIGINFSMLANNDFAAIRVELLEITRAARAARADVILAAYCITLPGRVDELAEAVRQGAFDELILHPPAEDQLELVRSATHGLKLKYSSMIESADELLAFGADRAGIPMIEAE